MPEITLRRSYAAPDAITPLSGSARGERAARTRLPYLIAIDHQTLPEMPAPNFKMLIKFQISELSENNPPAVKTPRGARRGELILVARNAEGQTDAWAVLTVPILSGENEWA